MKNFLYLLAVSSLSILFLACDKSQSDPETLKVFNELFQMQLIETVGFENSTAKLTADSLISDSRCPLDVVCVWEGLVEVAFSFVLEGTAYPIVLTLHEGQPQKAEQTIEGHTIRLVTVNPYPETSNTPAPEDYTFSLVVEK